MRRPHSAYNSSEPLFTLGFCIILAAILFPIFSRARENARRSNCQGQLKLLSLGVAQYMRDYDRHLPSSSCSWKGNGVRGGWMFYGTFSPNAETATTFDPSLGTLAPYVKVKDFICPSDGKGTGNSYALNGTLRKNSDPSSCEKGNSLSPGISSTAVRNPAETCLFVEEQVGDFKSSDDGVYFPEVTAVPTRHMEGSNYSFIDGHVKYYTPERIKASESNGTAMYKP